MSKNFELLQSLAKERDVFETGPASSHDLFETGAGTAVIAPAPRPAGAGSLSPQLAMGEGQKDEIGKLVQRIFLQREPGSVRSVLFAGTEPENGCSWTCARAAEILASHVSSPVCVVDANLRSPGMHQQFGIENHHGLTDSLLVNDPIGSFISPVRANLSMLSCGADPSNGRALLSSDRMRSRIEELSREFEFILIDAPAISLGNEALALARATDGVVLILKANSSRRESVRETIQQLESAKVRVLGAVLNQRTFPVPAAIYNRL
jgi:capsular exopolysaccharide synthesis family protein